MHNDIEAVYGNRVRVRVCGLHWVGNSLLVINHRHLSSNSFWSPPGGGIEPGFTAQEALIKEFKEETELNVEVGKHLFTCEFIIQPLHAIELFFEIKSATGRIQIGADPETEVQIIDEVCFKDYGWLQALPPSQKHGIFSLASTPNELKKLNGYIQLL
jgi:8-oxo-dGTP diphosphatase